MSYSGLARRECLVDSAVSVGSCSADTRAVGWNSFIHTTAPAGDEAGDQGPLEVSAGVKKLYALARCAHAEPARDFQL